MSKGILTAGVGSREEARRNTLCALGETMHAAFPDCRVESAYASRGAGRLCARGVCIPSPEEALRPDIHLATLKERDPAGIPDSGHPGAEGARLVAMRPGRWRQPARTGRAA